jgi:AP-3 complex subunit beta
MLYGFIPCFIQVITDFSQLTSHELLNKIAGQGLQAQYKFPRSPCIYSSTMITVEVTFINNSGSVIENIHVGEKVSIGCSFLFFS